MSRDSLNRLCLKEQQQPKKLAGKKSKRKNMKLVKAVHLFSSFVLTYKYRSDCNFYFSDADMKR